MEWKMVDLEERTDYDRKTGFIDIKKQSSRSTGASTLYG